MQRKVIKLNRAAMGLLGYSQEEIPELTFEKLFPEKEHERHYAEMETAVETGAVKPFETRVLTKDGKVIPILLSGTALKDARGEPIGFVNVCRDITDRVRAEEEKEKIQAQLFQAQKMEAIGTLAGGVTHDFNNLLTTIQGYTDLAMMEISETDPLYIDLKQISLAAVRAAGLTRQLLLFGSKQPMELIPLNINRTVDDLLKMLHRLIGEDVAVSTNMEPDLWTVRADAGNIEQVIMNLAVNARDAMPEGGRLTIKTENVTLDKEYCRAVSEARPGKFVRRRGRNAGYPAPPTQSRTCGFPASGSSVVLASASTYPNAH